MKIVICGSNLFKDKMIEFRNKLNEAGHEGIIHPDYDAFARGEKQEVWNQIQQDHAKAKKDNDYIKWYHDAIVSSDAVLVLNYDKNSIANYIGANTLMEMGLAFHLRKKIFLLNGIPDIGSKEEILGMQPIVINGDFSLIK